MTLNPLRGLSRREREALGIILASGEALTAEAVRAGLPDHLSNSATRSILRGLVAKGRVRVRRRGRAYHYQALKVDHASRVEALAETVRTFFGGSVSEAAAALVEVDGAEAMDDGVRTALQKAGMEGDPREETR